MTRTCTAHGGRAVEGEVVWVAGHHKPGQRTVYTQLRCVVCNRPTGIRRTVTDADYNPVVKEAS